ncbi:MAG: RagB/SusD family nutrient uptake outer membrane protein, partial [Butyricimonas faecihominis]
SPKSDVKSDDLFKDENGFWDVLTGVYSIMVTPSAYGRELSFGYLDVMAQYYDKITSQTHNYYKTKGYDYTDTQEETRLKSIWKGHYKAIVNLNVLLEYADKNKNVFASEQHYRIVKGEAFGLRAFLHFDLLRLFGPSPADGLEQQAIPYADTYERGSSRFLSALL